MNNLFKKLMRREFGPGNYERYCRYIYEEIEQHTLNSKRVFEEMYLLLQTVDSPVLMKKKRRLEQTLLRSLTICRGYFMTVVAVAVTAGMVLLLQPVEQVLYALLAVLGVGLAYKTVEYFVNRYCYVDARMVLIYKAVLEQLCNKGGQKTVMPD